MVIVTQLPANPVTHFALQLPESEVSRRPEDGGPVQLLGFTVSTFPNSRRRQDSQRAVSCFIKDHSTSNYRVTTVWITDRELQRGQKMNHKRMKERKSGSENKQ